MARTLVIDMSRMWLASLRPAPRGIERVDIALSRQLLEQWPGDVVGLSSGPLGLRVYDQARVRRLVERIETTWREQAAPEADPVFRDIRDWLAGLAPFSPTPNVHVLRHQLRKARRGAGAILHGGPGLGRPVSTIPQGAIFANFGHVGLVAPGVARLLAHRPDLKLATLLHDVLSLTDPHFFTGRNEDFFRKVFERAASRDGVMLVTTDHVRQQAETLASVAGIAAKVRTTDISEAFRHMPAPEFDPLLAKAPYFLLCGTREPRKNHMMILNVWRAMAADGQTPPKLVLAGGHGWGTELVDGLLARSELLRGHVAHAETLGSPGLFRIMGQARALLSPSFAEGYGLPVEEALRSGAEVIASRIQAFAEITVGCARLVEPLDGPGWRSAVLGLAMAPARDIRARSDAIARFEAARPSRIGVVERLSDL
jgi:glycosyltransferase involved in cell wall biosynthesis